MENFKYLAHMRCDKYPIWVVIVACSKRKFTRTNTPLWASVENKINRKWLHLTQYYYCHVTNLWILFCCVQNEARARKIYIYCRYNVYAMWYIIHLNSHLIKSDALERIGSQVCSSPFQMSRMTVIWAP